MESFKKVRLQHIQDVLTCRKKVINSKDVPARRVPHWPELALKNVYDTIVGMHPDMKDYLPDL